jgi:hypothetical protein
MTWCFRPTRNEAHTERMDSMGDPTYDEKGQDKQVRKIRQDKIHNKKPTSNNTREEMDDRRGQTDKTGRGEAT